jgi:hypothetical protein
LSLISMLPVLNSYLTLQYMFGMKSYWRTNNFTPSKVFSFSFHLCCHINCLF